MQILMLIVLAAVIVACLVLMRQIAAQRRLLASLGDDQVALGEKWASLSADTIRQFTPASGAVISIEILNPSELAAQESSLARPLGTVIPALIRRIVYQKTAEILRDELRQRGVLAEVKIHGLG